MGLRRGATIMLIAQWGRYGCQLVSLILLARVLSPGAFGVIAMASAVTGLAAVVGDFGLSLAALQAPKLDQQQRSALFWLNGALGLVTGALVALAAPLVAGLYGDQRLVPVVVALGSVFALNGFAVQLSVELNRAGRFLALGVIELMAQVGGLGVAVVMAFGGAGYWSLVGQQIASGVLLLGALAIAARWRPSLPRRGADVRELVRFGRDTFALQVANYVTSNIDSVLIGRLFGATVLGLYNRAFLVAMLPIQQIVAPLTRVVLPRLATLTDVEAFNAMLQRLQRLVTYALMGPLSLVAALATPLLVTLLGSRWAGAGPMLQVLALAAAFQSAGFVYYWAFLARARTGALFRSELWGRGVMVVVMLVVAPAGPVAVAWAVVLGQALIWAAAVVRYGARADVRSRALLQASFRPVVLFVIAFVAAQVLAGASARLGDLPSLLIGGGAWLAVVALAAAVPAMRADVASVVSVVNRRGAPT